MLFNNCLYSCQENRGTEKNVAEPATPGWALVPFVKVDSVNPLLYPGTGVFTCPIRKEPVKWESKDVFNPAVIVKNNKLFMLYRAEDTMGRYAGTSRIGLAESTDGLHFTRYPEPVIFPGNDAQKKYEWEGGCEDPRVASSKDLLSWTKHGPAFDTAFGGKYVNTWSKSGSIVSRYNNGKITATRINGRYWMYWGDVNIWAATSDDLVHWSPVLYANGEKPPIELRHNAKEISEIKIVFGPRPKKFDSRFKDCCRCEVM